MIKTGFSRPRIGYSGRVVCKYGNEPSGFIKGVELLDQLNDATIQEKHNPMELNQVEIIILKNM
jgi:hypothetical protein